MSVLFVDYETGRIVAVLSFPNNGTGATFIAGWVRDLLSAKNEKHQVLTLMKTLLKNQVTKLDSVAQIFFTTSPY